MVKLAAETKKLTPSQYLVGATGFFSMFSLIGIMFYGLPFFYDFSVTDFGHDAHTSSLLGTAWILNSLRHDFGGTIKLIFQTGEEKLPGGASLMIEAGVLENPAPEIVIGQMLTR